MTQFAGRKTIFEPKIVHNDFWNQGLYQHHESVPSGQASMYYLHSCQLYVRIYYTVLDLYFMISLSKKR